jgi:fructose-bisphosphate aldolase class II
MKEALKESVENHYAVGAFVTCDHSFSEAIVRAGEEKGVPIIMMVPEVGFRHMDLDNFFPYAVERIRRSSIPIALHLDHGQSYETVMKAIHFGCTSVMIDGSALRYEDNVALTKKVVEAAHAAGVSVEAELGHVAGGEGNLRDGSVVDASMFTKPEDAARFVKETDIDALAVAFGTVHGVYRDTPKLDLRRLQDIRRSVNIPLVMHGGSGLTAEDFRNAIKCGINKVNFFTELSLAAVSVIAEAIQKKEGYLHYPDLISLATNKAVEVIKEQIDIFGTLRLAY